MSNHRQVNKEEFEILTRFHPGEVRYYVDTGSQISRRKSTRVVVKRKQHGSKSSKPRGINGTGRGFNRPVMLTPVRPTYGASTLSLEITNSAIKAFGGNPLRVWGRRDLVKHIMRDTGYTHNSKVNPTITDLLTLGMLRYKSAGA